MGSGYAISVANLAAATMQAYASIKVAEEWKAIYEEANMREFAIADRIQARAEEQTAFWRNVFKGCEINFVDEVCAREPTPAHVDAAQFRVSTELRRTHDHAVREATRCIPLGCAGAVDNVRRTAMRTVTRTGAAAMYTAALNERNRVRLINAQNETVLRNMLGVGHKVYHSSTNALQAAAGIYSANANSAAASANSAMMAAGASIRMLGQALGALIDPPPGATGGGSGDGGDMGPQMPADVAESRDKELRDEINATADRNNEAYGPQEYNDPSELLNSSDKLAQNASGVDGLFDQFFA